MAEKKVKVDTKALNAKAGPRKLPKASRGLHLTTPEDRKLGRELSKAGLPTTVLKRKHRTTIDGATQLRHVHMLRSRGTHGSLAQHAKEDNEAYTAQAKALAHEARLQRKRLERTRELAIAVRAIAFRSMIQKHYMKGAN